MRPQGYEPRELARLLHSAYIYYTRYSIYVQPTIKKNKMTKHWQ
jgi:hypothetical protein